MANENDSTPKVKKSGKRWARDAGFFAAGAVFGAGATVAVGVLTDRLDIEPKSSTPDSTTKPAGTK